MKMSEIIHHTYSGEEDHLRENGESNTALPQHLMNGIRDSHHPPLP